MKKITESQLKDKVDSLREYLKVYENQQVDEWSLSPSSWFNGRPMGDSTSRDDVRAQDAAKNSTSGANLALVQHREQLAPGSVASETGKDGVTYAVDAKGMRTFKIENGKWVAMNPPAPTEQPELMAAPDVNQAASVTPANSMDDSDDANAHAFDPTWGGTKATGGQTVAPNAGAQWDNATQTAVATPSPDPAKVARFKELLAKAGVAAAPAPATGANVAFGQGAKLRANESTNYFLNKLRLIESRQLNEALTPEESKELDKLYGELSVDSQGNVIKDNPELAPLFADYQKIPSVTAAAPAAPAAVAAPAEPAAVAAPAAPAAPAEPAQAAPAEPAQAASVSTAGPVTWKQIYELNKDVIGKNPNLIKPGQQLKMPDGSTYTVKPGDNLSKIAKNAGAGQGAKTVPVVPGTGMQGSDQGAKTAPTGITPGQNARDDLLARQGKGQKTIDLSNSSKYTDGTPRVKAESVGYNELQRIVSLVNHR